MVYLISFIFFLLFFVCMALGFLIKGRNLKSESEANAILEGLTCASCKTNSSCIGHINPKAVKSASDCKKDLRIPHKDMA